MSLVAGITALAQRIGAEFKARPKGLSGFCSGKPAASEVVVAQTSPFAFTPAQANCRVTSSVAFTASSVFTIKRGSTTIGTATFAAAGTVAVIALTSPAIAKLDRVTIIAPATQDATGADIDFLIVE